jgi:hypothetical protein
MGKRYIKLLILIRDDVLKNKRIFIALMSCLILQFTGCTKPEIKQMVKPFEDIPIDLAKRIEFSNLTITSNEKDSDFSISLINNTE